MEKINQALFLFLNASGHPSVALVMLAQGLADYAIWIVPVVLVLGWLQGNESIRRLMLEATASGLAALLINQMIGLVWQHPRPFMMGLGYTLIPHVADSSFPSDHLTLLWAVSFTFLMHRRTRAMGAALALLGLPIAWARIYLGVHFPLDMAGAAMVAGFSAWLCAREGYRLVEPALRLITAVYRVLFAPFIRRGWMKQ
ncbi:undecaprenyl-diphosphatase [Alcaligenes faecalis]|uniref:undecaprenyl-diphosphatase n=1 Tax=Alcaligenes faecalis TaxID=511 RepID=UPI0024BC9BFB|nr:undecaprenyl-diphosphatase [Alcaligenes faecalis]WHQ45992.1 undecaprenyl-diphosphatase [Alcaligenes faecalis]